jgi:hypothetical protein
LKREEEEEGEKLAVVKYAQNPFGSVAVAKTPSMPSFKAHTSDPSQ